MEGIIFITATEMAEILGISKPYAYKIIKQLNEELEAKGLYVMEQYTDVKFVDRENITVAPDTHVIQASEKLGVISTEEAAQGNVQEIVANRWQEILKGQEKQ